MSGKNPDLSFNSGANINYFFMAAIKFTIKNKKSTKVGAKKSKKNNFYSIYVRMYHGRLFDFEKPISVFIEEQHWDPKNERVKRSIHAPNNEQINSTLEQLRAHMFSEFNVGMITGQDFDRKWFDTAVLSFFNRTEQISNEFWKIFFTDWCNYWLENHADKHKVSAEKYMSEGLKGEYSNFVNIFKEYQGKSKMKFDELTEENLDAFSKWLTGHKHYSYETTKRQLRRLNFFCEQAILKKINVPLDFRKTIFVDGAKKKNYLDPYFDEKEIKQIFDAEMPENLEDIRDNLIISVWTALRISDFSRLKISDIQGDFIEISATVKTGIPVVIPIHPMVKKVLEKRDGNLPKSYSDQKYNDLIKDVAKISGIDNIIYGGKTQIIEENGKKLRRKVSDFYPKYELVTSHIGRRSFATNLFGKVSNKAIMDIGGWSSEDMMLRYIKKTRQESAVSVKKIWENEATKRNII